MNLNKIISFEHQFYPLRFPLGKSNVEIDNVTEQFGKVDVDSSEQDDALRLFETGMLSMNFCFVFLLLSNNVFVLLTIHNFFLVY